MNSRPISEIWRAAANNWVEEDAAARLLEETKSSVFSQYCLAEGNIPVNKAEMNVRASDKWKEFLSRMVTAKTRANKAKVEKDYLEMKSWEARSKEATDRLEAKL